MRTAGLGLAALLLAGCGHGNPRLWSRFERMIDQRRNDAYSASLLFPDGKTMQAPPPGTVPRERPPAPPLVATGREGERYAEAIPGPLDAAGLQRGRRHFEIYCAACHGPMVDGQSPVADAMRLRKPPSFLSDRLRALPPGRIFAVITEGYGLMPSYADELPAKERWNVVGYVEALQLSRSLHLAELPPALQQEFRRQEEARP